MMFSEKIDWIINQHKNTNHIYDTYLPYEFHLKMAHDVFEDFKHLLSNFNDGETVFRDDVSIAVWGHDLIEDTRVSYNDVKSMLGYTPAEIIYAVTNEKGKTRSERANITYYEGIRNTPGAVFVKLCDRIANVQYSKMTKSKMFQKYKDENPNFEKMLGRYTDYKQLEPMFQYIDDLFN
jgi:(p)ppGpp synthase/HD superfamily hydrolase